MDDEFYRPETIEQVSFDLGLMVATSSVSNFIEEMKEKGTPIINEVYACLHSHMNCDWGELSKDDWDMNDEAVRSGEDRIFSSYTLSSGEKIWIITEQDRSATTILFPSDY